MDPKVLYKYGSMNKYTASLFKTPTLFFSSPADFNDPFECRPRLIFDGNVNNVVMSMVRSLTARNPLLTLSQAVVEAHVILARGGNIYSKPEVWDSIRRDMIKSVAQDVGMLCMSAAPDHILMWSHYADNHKGYCIAFAATDSTPFFGEAQQVLYQEAYPSIAAFGTSHQELADLMLLTKYKDWAYEQEYRIVDVSRGRGAREYPPELMLSVCFGLRMPQTDRDLIRGWILERGGQVAFHEAVQDEQDYKILARRID